jgi:RNA-directed DNA polymerase
MQFSILKANECGDKLGRFWTRDKPTGPVQSIIDSALDPTWGNSGTHWLKIEMPPSFEVVSYTRFADDLVVLVSGIPGNRHWVNKVEKRLREELNKLDLTINEDKSDTIDFGAGVPFDFLGYTFRWVPSRKDPKKNMVLSHPQKEKRTRFLAEISMLLRRSLSIPVEHAIKGKLNPRLRGWVNYFRWGNSGYDLSFVKWQIDMKVRKFATRQRPKRKGGRTWTNWSNKDLYDRWGLFSDYRVSWCREPKVHAT